MKDDGTAEYAYRKSVTDRADAERWRAEGRRRQAAGKKKTALPLYSGLVSAFLN
jgi:hypothetical protein